jgi:serralysin
MVPSILPAKRSNIMSSVYSSGTYTNVGSAPTLDGTVNALIAGTKWGSDDLGWSANVTFSFPTSFSVGNVFLGTRAFGYTGEPDNAGEALNATQINVARETLQKWANVASLTFREIPDTPDTELFGDNSSVGDIRFAMSNSPERAWAYNPGEDNSPHGGDAWFNKTNYNSPVVGSYAYTSGFMHEIGHALGLEHPHENKDGDSMSTSVDALKYSIMSYRDYVGNDTASVGSSFFPTTPMLYDVLAIQTLYGANWSYRSGNDTYSWAPGAAVYETIWDGGGWDTLNAANQTQNVELHLTSGVFSTIGNSISNTKTQVRDNLVIAFHATIENATGSAYNDTIFGNTAANTLNGGAGNDTMRGSEWAHHRVFDNDTMYGGAGDDFMGGHNGDDLMLGGSGNDSVIGDDGNDRLSGGTGNDRVVGDYLDQSGNGNDNMSGGSGDDMMEGGPGNDAMRGGPGTDVMEGDAGNDTMRGGDFSMPADLFKDYMYGQEGDDTLYGDAGDDVMLGGNGADSIYGEDGNDYLEGNAGVDLLNGGTGRDTASGGDGDDTIWGASSTVSADAGDRLYGEEGNDLMGGSYGNDGVYGGIGDDSLYGDEGNDIVSGGDGNDLLRGDWGWGSDVSGVDNLDGGNGNDSLYGGAGTDMLRGGNGADLLDGGTGIDNMDGGNGNDTYRVDNEADVVSEGSGNVLGGVDTVSSSVTHKLSMNLENLTLTGMGATQGIGSAQNNVINGNSANNTLSGLAGNDILFGGGGNDVLRGDSGVDRLNGGAGNDNIVSDGDGGTYNGDENDDVMFSGLGRETMNGGSGSDTINHTLFNGNYLFNMATGLTNLAGERYLNFENADMGNGNDTVTGTAFDNGINGGGGNDVIFGGGGNDTLRGNSGVDRLNGGAGNDNIVSDGDGGTYNGDADDDLMFSGLGRETMNGGSGSDTINHTFFNGNYVFNMATGLTNLAGERYLNFENADMGNGNDTVTGTASDNGINGGGGNDTIFGGGGNDLLIGGLGRDNLTGGGGADRYYFSSVLESFGAGRDTIHFNSGQDRIDLTAIDANDSVLGNQAFDTNQLTFNRGTGIFTANVRDGAELSIRIVGNFSFTDVNP